MHGRHKGVAASPRLGRNEPPLRIFRSDRLERLTLISLRVFLSTWIPLLLCQLAAVLWFERSPVRACISAILGFAAWFVFEYLMHRFLFHLESRNKQIAALVWIMHTNHHIQPSHRLRTLMPLSVSLPLAVLIELAGISVFGAACGVSAALGFFCGYVVYDLTHYACHNSPMKGRYASSVKRHHMRHHFVDDERNFSITVPLIDKLFLTRD